MGRGANANLGINIGATNNATGVIKAVIADLLQLDGATNRSGKNFKNLATGVVESMIVWHSARGAINALKDSIQATIQAGIEWEKNMATVKRTVEGTPQQIAAIGTEIRQMAKEMPVAANDLAKIAAMAGQLGVRTEDITRFTAVIAKLSATTNLVGEKGAQQIARFANIVGATGPQIDQIADSIYKLGISSAATETEILGMSLRLAGAGITIGMSSADVMGFAAALSDVGIRAEMGGSAISKVMVDIASAVASGGEKLDDFAAVAQMSSADFKKAFEEDAASAIVAFVEGLKTTSDVGRNVFATLEQLDEDGIRVRDTLLRLANSQKDMNDALAVARGAYEEGGSLNAAFGERAKTTAAQLEILKNQIHDVMIEAGTQLMPVVVDLLQLLVSTAEALRPFTPILTAIAAILPDLVKLIVATGVALVALRLTQVAANWITLGSSITSTSVLMDGAAMRAGLLKESLISMAKSPTAILAGLVVGVAALDFALKKMSGYGIADHLFGDIERIKAGKRALEEIQALTYKKGSNQINKDLENSLKEQADLLNKLISRQKELGDSYESARFKGAAEEWFKNNKAIKQNEENIKAFSAALKQNGADMDVVANIYFNSSEKMQGFIRESTGFNEAFFRQTVIAEKAKAVLDAYTASLTPAERALQGIATEADIVARNLDKAFQLESSERALEGLKQAAEDQKEAWDGLVDSVSDILPEIGQTFEEWKKELELMTQAYVDWQSNIDGIYGLLLGNSIENSDAIIAAVIEQGPIFAAYWAKFFVEDQQAAMKLLAGIAPHLGTTAAINFSSGINSEAGTVAGAIDNTFLAPMRLAANSLDILTRAFGAEAIGHLEALEAVGTAVEYPSLQSALEKLRTDAANALESTKNNIKDFGAATGKGGGAADKVEELKTAIEGFNEVFERNNNFAELINVYGEGGASLMQAFTDAMNASAEDAYDAGKDFAEELNDLIDDLKDSGVKNADELGRNLMEAAARAIRENTPEAVQAMNDAIAAINTAMTADENMKLNAETFGDSLAKALTNSAMEAKIGSAGMRLMELFREAASKGTKENIDALTESMADMIQGVTEKALSPGAAAQLTSALTNAFNDLINNQTPENEAKLAAAMANIKLIMEGAALDVATNTYVMADSIRGLASSIGIDAEYIVQNIGFFVKTGLFGMLDSIKSLPSETKKEIDKIIAMLNAGKIPAETAAKQLMDAIMKGIREGNKSTSASNVNIPTTGQDPSGGRAKNSAYEYLQNLQSEIDGAKAALDVLHTNIANLNMDMSVRLDAASRAIILEKEIAGMEAGLAYEVDLFAYEASMGITPASKAADKATMEAAAKEQMAQFMAKFRSEEYKRRVAEILPHIRDITKQLNGGGNSPDVEAYLRGQLKFWQDKLKKARDGIDDMKPNAGIFGPTLASMGTSLPSFGNGVRGFGGGYAWVGEHGPEIVKIPRGADVYSNAESKGIGGVTVVVNINSPVTDAHSIRRVIPTIKEELRRLDKRI